MRKEAMHHTSGDHRFAKHHPAEAAAAPCEEAVLNNSLMRLPGSSEASTASGCITRVGLVVYLMGLDFFRAFMAGAKAEFRRREIPVSLPRI